MTPLVDVDVEMGPRVDLRSATQAQEQGRGAHVGVRYVPRHGSVVQWVGARLGCDGSVVVDDVGT